MRRILSEKNLVIVLFFLVFVTFSLAQEDTRKIEKMYLDTTIDATSQNQPAAAEQKIISVTEVKITPDTRLR
ncbi:MAG: hypothetical protein JNN00_02005 [Chitinophagaceae bacterium]|nr:hypothetical protein [Chitinophagaceae bacterium]